MIVDYLDVQEDNAWYNYKIYFTVDLQQQLTSVLNELCGMKGHETQIELYILSLV